MRKYTLVIILLALFGIYQTYELKKVSKKYKDLVIKINNVSEAILVESTYETIEEIYEKKIIIYDTLITDDKTLFLLKKYE